MVCSGSTVTEINRGSAGLAGPLANLSALTGLQALWLHANKLLTGDIVILKGLTNLKVLYLGYTGLRGFLGDLSTLTQLEELNVDVVPLGTPMPDLANFKKLRILSIWQSGVVGLIPASLSSLTNLERLNLGYNGSLTGNIPNLSALTKLSYLDLSSNKLTGNIPDMSSLIRLGHAYYSTEDYTLTVPALEVPLLSFLGDALGESLYYETELKQVNGTNDRFVLQKITELVKVETDATCAKFDLDQGLATIPMVDVKLPIPGPIGDKNFGFNTEQYAVTLKWMPILGAEVFVIESINKIVK